MARTDAMVLGAGIVGVSVALNLVKRGLSVALVERAGIGEQTSYGNSGVIEGSTVLPPAFPSSLVALARVALKRASEANYHLSFLPRVAPWLLAFRAASRPDRIAETARLNRPLFAAAMPEHEALMQEADATRYLRETGWMKLYRSERAFEALALEFSLAAEFGLPLQQLDTAGAQALEPSLGPVFKRAVFWPRAASLSNPLAVTQAYAARFATLGGIALNGDARSLHRNGNRWRVETNEGAFDAEHVVVALGPWAPDLLEPLGLKLPMAVKRGYHRHFRGEGNAALSRPVVDVDFGYLITPMEQGIRLTTGAEFAARDAKPTPVQFDRLLPRARDAVSASGARRRCDLDGQPAVLSGFAGRDRPGAEACRAMAGDRSCALGPDARACDRASARRHDHRRHAVPRPGAVSRRAVSDVSVVKHVPVVIVGGGPVGIALALDLGLRGISCALFETRAGMHAIPKGQNLTQRTLEHFYFWGIADELRAARLMPLGFPIGEITAYGDLTSPYWQAPAGRELVRPYYFQDNERLPQYRMEEVLRRKLATVANVEARFGWTRRGGQRRCRWRARHCRRGGRRRPRRVHRRLRCRLRRAALAGARRLRHRAQRHRLRPAHGARGVSLARAARRLKRFPERSTYRVMHPDLDGYWQFFGRIDVGEGFFFHAPVDRNSARDNFDFRGPLRRAAGFDFACDFDHTGFWELRNAVAETYRAGRAFIAGDAAHSHPPYGGFGLNNGLEDAVNLGWKLAARLAGWGGDALLASYGAERRPVFRDVAEDFIAARIREDGAFLRRFNPERDRAEFERAWAAREGDLGRHVHSYEPNYEGSPVVAGVVGGVSGAHGEHSFAARPGHHLAPQPLSSGRNVFEELGRGFSLHRARCGRHQKLMRFAAPLRH